MDDSNSIILEGWKASRRKRLGQEAQSQISQVHSHGQGTVQKRFFNTLFKVLSFERGKLCIEGDS